MTSINNLKIILVSICALLSFSLFSQNEETKGEGVIVMTKTELNSFLSTVAEARRAQLEKRDARDKKEYLAELRLKYENQAGYKRRLGTGSGNDNTSNQQILNELRYLNQRIDNLSSNYNRTPNSGRDNSTIIVPGNSSSPSPAYRPNGRSTTTVVPGGNNNKIEELQNQIDSLKNVKPMVADYKQDVSVADSLNMMNGRLQNVRRQLDSLESRMTNDDTPKLENVAAVDRLYFKQQVYFDNNSDTLKADYIPYIQDLTQILLKYPETKIMLEGWASPKGKPSYNKMLSMRRAEAVEEAFKNNRINVSRIITSFRGEDTSSSEQYARRVDMSIIVR